MKFRVWLPALGGLLLCGCARQPTLPDGAIVLDEEVALVRADGAIVDTASREFVVNDDATLIAIADENLVDVRLGLQVEANGDMPARSAEVENHLGGAGLEVAALEVSEGARVRVTLTSGADATQPGKVRVRVQQFAAGIARDPGPARRLDALRAWAKGSSAALRIEGTKSVSQDLELAIAGLGIAPEDAALAAQARLARARQLIYFHLDRREARAEAQRAAAAFAKLAPPDDRGAARAKYVEGLALAAMSEDPASTNPTAAEALQLARETFTALAADSSALAPVERAHAVAALGRLDVQIMHADAANAHFEEARSIYLANGHLAGELEMRVHLAFVLVEKGSFHEAAQAFDSLLPDLPKIVDPEMRVRAYLAAGRGRSFSGRVDEAAELLLAALPVAREYQLRDAQASALQGLGNLYANRGDYLQAGQFFEEALNITRGGENIAEYVTALAAAGQIARHDGNYQRALTLHLEATRLAPVPVLQVRTRFDLGADYYRLQDIPAAIATYREALAIDLQDPMHHVFTDGKLGLAQFLIEYEQSSATDLEEAERLIEESMVTSRKVQDQWRVIYATRMRGQLAARRGHAAPALRHYQRVLELGREYRLRSGSSEARSTLLVDEQFALQGFLDIGFADVVRRGPGVVRAASAVELAALLRLERARQESFGALRVAKLDAASAERVDGLLAEMGTKSVRIAALATVDLDAKQAAELRNLQIDMARLHAELDFVRTTAADQRAAAAPSMARWRPLAPGEAQLSYALSNERVFALVRSASGTRLTVLAPPRRDLERKLAEIGKLDVRSSPEKVEAALAEVSAELLPAGLLPADSNSVAIVAEGRIASLPFAALRSPTDTRRRLIETHEISMITSLLDVDEAPPTRHARPYRLVALASGSGTYRAAPVNPVPTLQAATKEINAVAALFKARDAAAPVKLLTGEAGTSVALREVWSSGADVVHFATHALADLRQPVASLLVLPAMDVSGKATYLTAGQVQGWHGDAELVFLSACESAIGPPQFAAGMPGLQRAFLRAGARGVIATLAPIEDVLAQQFATDFYSRYTGGQSAKRALSETQRAWLAPAPGVSESEQLRRRVTALAHAYFAG
jgi:tetratricopeptide (TPR) repeat protein